MDQKEQLYNLYLKNKIITDKVSLKMWNQMSKRQQEDIFNLGKGKGLFTDKIKLEQFTTLWSEPVKKKDDSEFSTDGVETTMESDTITTPENTSSDTIETIMPQQEEEVEEEVDVNINMQEAQPTDTVDVDVNVQQPQVIPEQPDSVLGFSETPRFNQFGTQQNLNVREKDTAIERAFGKNFATDFVGDLYRSFQQGQAQGSTLDESLELFTKGNNVTEQDIQDFIVAQQSLQNLGESDEMREFNRIYQQEGGGLWGFIKGNVLTRGQTLPQLLVSSVSQMLNPATIGMGVAGGTAGSFIPVIGTIGGALGAATTTLETGITFAELLQKELTDRNLDFTNENVRTILEDEEALSSIRYKSAGRGIAIGITEAATARIAGAVGAKILAKGPATLGRNLKALGSVAAIEGAGGSTGEIAGNIVAGQELDAANIGFEGIVGLTGTPISGVKAIYQRPKYYVNKQNGGEDFASASAEQAQDIIDNAPDEDFDKVDIEIVNNPKMKAQYDKRKIDLHDKAVIEGGVREAYPEISQDKIDKIIPLQKKLNALGEDTGEAAKLKRSEIKKEINEIIKTEDAVQEQSTDEVVSEVQATDIQEVESGGATTTESTREEQQTTETTEETETTEKEVEEPPLIVRTEEDLKKIEQTLDETDGEEKLGFKKRKDGKGYVNRKIDISEAPLFDEVETVGKNKGKKTGKKYRKVFGSPKEGTSYYIEEGKELYIGTSGILRPSPLEANKMADGIYMSDVMFVPSTESQTSIDDKVNEVTPEPSKKKKEPKTPLARNIKRKRIPKSRTLDIETDAEGNVQVVERATGRPYKKKLPAKIQEYLLKEGIDVNEGRTAEQIFEEENPGASIQSLKPEQVNDVVAKSENVREVAEAIENEKEKANQSRDKQLDIDSSNDFETLGLTEKEWAQFNDKENLTPQIKRKYIIKETPDNLKRVGESIEGFDSKIQEIAERLNQDPDTVMENFFDYAIKNPTKRKVSNTKQARSQALNDLEARFEELTGLKPTQKNIKAVLSVDPNRLPLEVVQEDLQARDVATSKEPKVNKSKKVSAKKIVEGTKKKKEVTVDEAEALKDQIKLEGKAAKEADAAAKKKDKEKITKKKIQKARKNIRSKIGAAQSLNVMLNRMLAVNESIVPDSVKKQYQQIVNTLADRKGALDLRQRQQLINEVEAINKALDEEYSVAGELAERYDYFRNVTFNITDKTTFEETIAEMLKQEIITPDEAKLMKKYKKNISPTEKVEKTEEQIAEEKDKLIDEIEDVNKFDVPTDLSRDQKSLVFKFRKLLLNREALGRLETYQLKLIKGLLNNIENGFVPHLVQKLTQRLTAIERSNNVESSIENSKPLKFSMMYAKFKDLFTKKGAVLELIRRNPLAYVDQIFGDFKTKNIYNALFEPTAKAQSRYASATKEIRNKINEARNKVFKSFNNDPNLTTISAYKQQLYLLQREYEANPGNRFVNPAVDVLKATIAAVDEQKTSLTAEDANALQDILDTFSTEDGTSIDNTKLFNSFNAAEKASIKTMDEINQSNEAAAVFTASTIRGNSFNPLNDYVHHNVLFTQEADSDASQPDFVSKYKQGLKPSTKGQSLIERTGTVMPLNFNVYSSTQKGAEYVMLDYHMTSPLQTARMTISETKKRLEEKGRIPPEQREMLNALEKAYEEVNTNVLTSDFGETTIADRAADFMSRQGYRTVLAGTGRFAAELLSNIGMAMFVDHKAFSDGLKYQDMIFSDVGAIVMDVLGSAQKDRVYAEGLAGRFVDPNVISRADQSAGSRINSDIQNKIKQIYSFVDQKYIGSVEQIADFLISTPDKVVMRPMWFGTFANEFKNITGKDIDFNKITSKDQAYIKENKAALDEATTKADEVTTFIGAADNPYMGILKGTSKPNDSVMKKGFNNFNNFMTRFLIFEFVTARTALNAITTDNSRMSGEQGAKILAGVTTRMMTYSLLSSMLGAGLLGLFFDDDEEDKSLDKQFGQALGQTFTSLLIGRDFGNAVKAILNIGVEKFNESHLEFLRDGEYDPYKDSLQYSVLPKKQQGQSASLGDLLLRFGGSFGPALSTADLIVRKTSEPKRKTADARERQLNEQLIRMPLEIAGNLGLIPIYKDVRKVAIKEIYKDLRKANKSKGKKRSAAEMEKLKKTNRTLYNQLIAKEKKKGTSSQERVYKEFIKNRTLWRQRNPGKRDPKRPK
tara:strand:- start:2825 stop:9385 length:6561 start_codon:yes stop_codon:yes gene_type:complete